MIRTQIQLTDEQASRLKDLALERGVSMAEVIRQSLDVTMEQGIPAPAELRRRAAAAAGKFRSRKARTSVEHDRLLAEIYSK